MRGWAILSLVLILTAGCGLRERQRLVSAPGAGSSAPPVAELAVPAPARDALASRAAEVVAALADRDLGRLAVLIHPNKGVRLSPSAHIDLKADRVLSGQQLEQAWLDETLQVWGFEDATGDPIRLNFRDYFQRFVYDADFAEAERIAVDTVLGRGTTVNNLAQAYPGARFVEYHFPGFNPGYQGLDWKSLRLVFEQSGGDWYLVGIVHDQWTI